MALGDFLVAYLQRLGVTHLFGIPGDLVMRLFLRFGQKRGLRIVTMSHEPGVGFAADGYARATGRLGVICVSPTAPAGTTWSTRWPARSPSGCRCW
jgi:acetolactate synthase-1/2/3 large subunit